MVRHLLTRATLLGVTAWLASAGVIGTVAWRAVSVLNAGGESTGLLSTAEVRSALDDAQARAASSTPPPAATAFPTIPPTVAPGTEVARTWALPGGTVAATCTGTSIGLDYATPQDGWTVEVHSPGPAELEVELHRGEQELVVRAQCVDGEPVPQIDDADNSGSGPAPAPAPAQAPRQSTTPATSPTSTPHESDSPDHDTDDEHSSPQPSPSTHD